METGHKFSSGVIVGKFYPFHKGHALLIRTGRAQCEKLTVLACSLPSETIPGAIRASAIQEAFPDVRVIHISEILPQYPNQHKDFWTIWVNVVKSNVPDVDVLFTSENYGDPFATYLGVPHICVDKPRRTVPISGTQIRNRLTENWHFLMPGMQRYFQRRICVIGPESTGKTTLTRGLITTFPDSYLIQEFGRQYVTSMSTTHLAAYDFLRIAQGHAQLEREAPPNSRLVISDTDAFTTKTFYDLYRSRNKFVHDPIVYRDLCKFVEEESYDLYLLTNIDIPWIQDGQRDFPHSRTQIFNTFLNFVSDKPHYVIQGSTPMLRLQLAYHHISCEIKKWDAQIPLTL